MANFKQSVPVEFYNKRLSKKPLPTVVNVGELKRRLAELPDELPVVGREDLVMGMTVFNVSDPDKAHLCLDVENPDYFE